MNATDIKLMTLYEEYLPFLRGKMPSCSDEYVQEGYIRLLFGVFENEKKYGNLNNKSLLDMLYIPGKNNDIDYFSVSVENELFMNEHFSDGYRPEADYFNIDKFVNSDKKGGYQCIALNPFGNKPENMSEKEFKETERVFLAKQINILRPDAIIIADYYHKDFLDVNKLKKILGEDIVFTPIPYTPNYIKKWGYDESYNLSLIEGVKGLEAKIYIYKYDEYDKPEHFKDLVTIISNHIKQHYKRKQ